MSDSTVISTKNLNLWYNEKHALQDITMEIEKKKTTALIGTFRVREIHAPALLQPDERSHHSSQDDR